MSFLIVFFFIGIICIIIGHYEYQKKMNKKCKPKTIYKFIDAWEEEQHKNNIKDVYNEFSGMFQNKPLLLR